MNVFRNYLSAALNNLIRNKLYAAINIFGLAVGFAAAILIGLYVRDEFSYDRWIPGADTLYSVYSGATLPGRPPMVLDGTDSDFASYIRFEVPGVSEVTRLMPVKRGLRRGDVETDVTLYWVDSNFFAMLPMPVYAGKAVFRHPDDLVITRRMARKFFGTDDAVGKTIELDRAHPLQVVAVLEDFPSNTNLIGEVFASGKASFSNLAQNDARAKTALGQSYSANVHTLVRLRRGVSVDQVQKDLSALFPRHRKFEPRDLVKLSLMPLTQRHLSPSNPSRMAPPHDIATVYAVAGIGILILIIAIINFVNLMTARASRRALEVGIRKASGAGRHHLIAQFVGEAMLFVTLSTIIAFATAELLLPLMNGFLGRSIAFDYWREPLLLGAIVVLVLIVGLLAGTYPAFVLSAFQPAAVLKAGKTKAGQVRGVRALLVVLQFAILIGLIIAAGVVYQQTQFALTNALRIDKDQVLLVEAPCHTALEERLRTTSGVRAVTCASETAMDFDNTETEVELKGGRKVFTFRSPVTFGFFEFYGIKPVAGRLLSERHTGDAVSDDAAAPWHPPLILNERAVKAFGFTGPQAAIGQMVRVLGDTDKALPSEIVGVVPDISFKTVREEVGPAVYYVDSKQGKYLSLRLDGNRIPETLASVDRIWRQSGPPHAITRFFLDARLQELYLDVIRQGQVFAGFAALAVLIASLGLFGLSAFTAEQRTKEIGIRKAMGADTGDILRLLLWQFAKPVLWANVIAWPVAAYLMERWLQGFAYRIALSPWLFLAASGLALVIAVATVLTHALLVARAKPVTALRYE